LQTAPLVFQLVNIYINQLRIFSKKTLVRNYLNSY
jgi:hypothetical protein